jgi:3-oxosteroid 1-dehydrogenase
MAWDETWDLVVVGSGGGAMAAGVAARDLGKSVLLLEKTDKIGGSTAMSGGVLWIPNHPLQAAAGVDDSYEAGLAYMNAAIGDAGPASSPTRKSAFLRAGPPMIELLQRKGVAFERAEGWSDYYDELPGGCPRSRSLISPMFDTRELGDWNDKLRRGPITVPVAAMEGALLTLAKRSIKGMLMALRFGLRLAKVRMTGKQLYTAGVAVQGRVLQAALRQGVEFRLNSAVVDLVFEGDRVTGVVAEADGVRMRIKGRDGVLIAAGGFSHNAEMRAKYQPQPSNVAWTNANPGDTGDLIQIAMRHGAATDLLDQTIWVPSSCPPGKPLAVFHVAELAKPHAIVVDKAGKRFADEACSYMEFGQRMYATGAVPAYVIIDSRHRNRYPWNMAAPGVTPKDWLESGYMKKADSLAGLAAKCGIDPAGLEATVARFNGFAQAGKDLDFKRGERVYDTVWADYTSKPSPTLGTLEKAPFYAVELVPGDVGTFGGILTDEHARVVREDGSIIPGLYAAGNSTASVMGRCYPGAGASIAASFVFGFIAARHAAGAQLNV